MNSVAAADLFSLKKRTILLTGGAGGLGLTITEALLEYGADVVVTDKVSKPPENGWDHLKQVAEKNNTYVRYLDVDTTDREALDALFFELYDGCRYPLRGLVACAGISERHDAIDYPIDQFRHVLDTNVTGTFLAAQGAAKLFRREKVPGSIVIVASMSGRIVNRGVNTSAYNASKAALHQLTRSLAAEWSSIPGNHSPGLTHTRPNTSPPIRVNSLSPGYIRTEATAPTLRDDPALEKLWESGSMLGRLSWAEEYRAPVLFLLGDGSSYVTGTDLRVDGGAGGW